MASHQWELSKRPGRAMLPHAMAEKTLFEKICDKEIPATLVHEDEHCVAFRDISPQAPVHVLVVPRKPIPRVGLAGQEDGQVLGHLLLTAAAVARSEGLAESGYRLVINNGRDGGEAVPHLHVHLLGGRKLNWPPG
jgi:histidine triad (HIT) family protein